MSFDPIFLVNGVHDTKHFLDVSLLFFALFINVVSFSDVVVDLWLILCECDCAGWTESIGCVTFIPAVGVSFVELGIEEVTTIDEALTFANGSVGFKLGFVEGVVALSFFSVIDA